MHCYIKNGTGGSFDTNMYFLSLYFIVENSACPVVHKTVNPTLIKNAESIANFLPLRRSVYLHKLGGAKVRYESLSHANVRPVDFSRRTVVSLNIWSVSLSLFFFTSYCLMIIVF